MTNPDEQQMGKIQELAVLKSFLEIVVAIEKDIRTRGKTPPSPRGNMV